MVFIKTSLLVLLLVYWFNKIYLHLVRIGVGVEYGKVVPGSCRIIPGIECGSEKISVTSDGLAFITNGFSMLTACNKNYLQGRMYLFDFSKPQDNVTELIIHGDAEMIKTFHPHGMDVLEQNGLVEVYVVNHAEGGKETIELFHYKRSKRNSIFHIQTITNSKFVCLNDIAVVSSNKFYVTNFLKYCHAGFAFMVAEFFLSLHTADIVYYENGNTKVVADNEVLYNGLVLSQDQKQLIVAAGKKHALDVFNRDVSGDLIYLKTIPIVGSPDNIVLDKISGSYYVGVHKKVVNFLLSVFNKTEDLPGTGVKVTTADNTWNIVDVVEMLHMDESQFLKGTTTVIHYNRQYLIGSAFHKLGYCIQE